MISLLFCILLYFPDAFAGRPFITDDAGVVKDRTLQVETWLFEDERSLQHWLVPTVGYKNIAEFSISAVQGLARRGKSPDTYSISGPILQSKALLIDTNDDRSPGLSVVAGTITPYGSGEFRTHTWDYFYYLASSTYLSPSKIFNIHLNLGRQTRRQFQKTSPVLLWGIAIEARVAQATHCFVETSNGEIYALIPGVAAQMGFRHDFKEEFQLDGTFGSGLSGEPELPYWVTLGVRYLFGY